MNSGASSSSSVCRSALAKASRKRRASALFSSSDDTGASSSLLLADPVSLAGLHHEYDATRRDQVHRLEAYSPECVEGEFSEVELRLYGVLRSSAWGYGTPQRKEGDV